MLSIRSFVRGPSLFSFFSPSLIISKHSGVQFFIRNLCLPLLIFFLSCLLSKLGRVFIILRPLILPSLPHPEVLDPLPNLRGRNPSMSIAAKRVTGSGTTFLFSDFIRTILHVLLLQGYTLVLRHSHTRRCPGDDTSGSQQFR